MKKTDHFLRMMPLILAAGFLMTWQARARGPVRHTSRPAPSRTHSSGSVRYGDRSAVAAASAARTAAVSVPRTVNTRPVQRVDARSPVTAHGPDRTEVRQEVRQAARIQHPVGIGKPIRTLPHGYTRVYVGGYSYYYYGGSYYVADSAGYLPVEPPEDAIVYEVPEGFFKVSINNKTYYTSGDIFYLECFHDDRVCYVKVDKPT